MGNWLSQSRYRTIVLLITAVPEEPQEHEERGGELAVVRHMSQDVLL